MVLGILHYQLRMSEKSKDFKKGGKKPPPSINKFMHPRNPYRITPSFKLLATKYPEFRKHCTYEISGKVRLDFSNPDAVGALTISLLHQDFDLQVKIPPNRLVPALPQRLNYLLWLEDLLGLAKRHSEPSFMVVGIDVGTGAAAVYPLLGARKFSWSMIGTETDEESYHSAVNNASTNNLQENIFIKKVKDETYFYDLFKDEDVNNFIDSASVKSRPVVKNEDISLEDIEGLEQQDKSPQEMETIVGKKTYPVDFTMCNPPFFSCEVELDTMKKSKGDRKGPVSGPTGSNFEKIVKGGELSFIENMVKESVLCKDKVRIFTTLIGTVADAKIVKQMVEGISPTHMAQTEFCQGRTMRWGIAWTFDPQLSLEKVVSKKTLKTVKPCVLTIPRSMVPTYSVPIVWRQIESLFREIKIKPQVKKRTKYFVYASIKAYKALWLHQRRKKREKAMAAKLGKALPTSEETEGAEVMETNDGGNTLDNETDALVCDEEPIPKRKISEVEEEYDDSNEEINKRICMNDDVEAMIGNKLMLCDEDNKNKDLTNQQSGGLECIVKATVYVKQITGGIIQLEMVFCGGSLGKNGLNQLYTYIKNKLTNVS